MIGESTNVAPVNIFSGHSNEAVCTTQPDIVDNNNSPPESISDANEESFARSGILYVHHGVDCDCGIATNVG